MDTQEDTQTVDAQPIVAEGDTSESVESAVEPAVEPAIEPAAAVEPISEESHVLDLSQTLGEEGQGVAQAAEDAAQESHQPQAIDTAADAATAAASDIATNITTDVATEVSADISTDTPVTDSGVHPAQASFLSQNKVYIAAGIVGVVVVTIAAGVMLSMGSSSRLQGMLDKRLMEQSAETSALPAGLNKTETFAEEAVTTEAVTTEGVTTEAEVTEATAMSSEEGIAVIPKGPTIKAVN